MKALKRYKFDITNSTMCQNASIFFNIPEYSSIFQYSRHNEKCMQIVFEENKFPKKSQFPLFQFFFDFESTFSDILTFSGILVFSVLLELFVYNLPWNKFQNGNCLWMQSCYFVYSFNSQGDHQKPHTKFKPFLF